MPPATPEIAGSPAHEAEALAADVQLERVASWKRRGGHVVGCAPAYVPTEIVDAAGALPVHVTGGSPALEVVGGDAYFQSAICHLPRSIVELGLRGALDTLDLLVIPSTCDVLRNLVGTLRLLWPSRPVRYLELPQRFDTAGFRFYRGELERLCRDVETATGAAITTAALRRAIAVHDERRSVIRALDELRAEAPWRVPTSELATVIRAGATIPPIDHLGLLERYLAAAHAAPRPPLDVARVVLAGAFCEQPPIGFLRTLERAGCAIVDDDLLLGMRWLDADVGHAGDPLDALASAYLRHSPLAPSRYEHDRRRGDALVERVRARRAEGVILASPSFCDPALLDRPALLDALDRAGIPSLALQYAENSADFGAVREQAGTFADALRLWEAS